MKLVSLIALIITLGLSTGCMLMSSPVCKDCQAQSGVGRYQIAGDGQGHFMKIDTKTGKAWSTGGPKWADWFEVPER